METTIANWGEALATSLTGALSTVMAAIPSILAFLLIVIVGWFVASLLAGGLRRLLRAMQFNKLSRRSGFSDFVESMGVGIGPSAFIAAVAKWFVRLIALVVAFDALGLPAVSDVLERLLLWLPNLAVAIVVLVVGGLAANAFANVVRGLAREGGFETAHVMAAFAKASVWAFAIIIAVNELGVATTLVNALFIAVIGSMALAFGLSFGLGGREAAAEIIAAGRQTFREAEPKIREAAVAADERLREGNGLRSGNGSHRRHPTIAEEMGEHDDERTQTAAPGATNVSEPRNHGKPWTDRDLETLQRLADSDASAQEIASRLHRTEDAVVSKAHDENISLQS